MGDKPLNRKLVVSLTLLVACGGSGSHESTTAVRASTRYSLANGCWRVPSDASGSVGPFFLKPTALGRYLFLDQASTLVSADGSGVRRDPTPSEASVWTLEEADGIGRFTVFSESSNRFLDVDEATSDFRLVETATALTFELAEGCAVFPEAEVNATGEPFKGNGVGEPVLGFAESHLHITATDFLADTHYGRPFHRFGVTHALGDCAERHGPNGLQDYVGNVYAYSDPLRPHDTRGWPTFGEWPNRVSRTHEQTYYKWLERAWRAGLRVLVNLLVENETLCSLQAVAHSMPLRNCNEMDSARLQVRQIHDLQDYIDAQEGGPGKGWFRIVTSPAEARQVIDEGKLAVILGIEASHLFDCGVKLGVPQCDEATIERELDEFYDLGVRMVFPIHEFDNAFGGNGIFNDLFLNLGNFYDTGRFWETYECPDQPYYYEAGSKLRGVPVPASGDPITGALIDATGGLAPIYDPNIQHCNARWLTDLGRFLIERLIAKKVMIDVDHLELEIKSQVLDIAEAQDPPYPVMSSHGGHGGISEEQARRIFALGGLIFDYKGNGREYVASQRQARAFKDDRFFFGYGFGADTNGLGAQADPRVGDDVTPVPYPFTLFQGEGWGPEFADVAPVTFDRQRTGERIFDTNVEGMAHYGLVADFVEEVRLEGGEEAIRDLYRSAEAYLQMWEHVVNR